MVFQAEAITHLNYDVGKLSWAGFDKATSAAWYAKFYVSAVACLALQKLSRSWRNKAWTLSQRKVLFPNITSHSSRQSISAAIGYAFNDFKRKHSLKVSDKSLFSCTYDIPGIDV